MASSTLQECALDWYELFVVEIDESTLECKQFKERFELKFILESKKEILARCFVDLKQRK